MAIIAISQQLGCRGSHLGQLVANRLGYRFMSREDLVAEISRAYPVTLEQLGVIDERQPHFWSRLKTDTERFVAFLRAAVLHEMARDRLVLVDRSAAALVPSYACTFKTRLVGPFEARVGLVAESEKLSAVAAQRRVRDHDREVRARVQTLTGIDIEDPLSYDLVINDQGSPLEFSALALAGYAAQIDARVGPEQWQLMRDAATAAQVRAACHAHPKLGNAPIAVACHAGAVQVRGPGLVPPWDELANQIASGIEGVRSVEVMAEEVRALEAVRL